MGQANLEGTRETRRIIRYEDLNVHGTLFGGKLAMWIDEAAGIHAVCQMNHRRIVTVKISELLFKQPARLYDILEFRCSTIREGRTSLTVRCQVYRIFGDEPREISRAEIVFVAVDEKGRPTRWKTTP